MRNSKGITLIALIITIVVLLILAGVAIGTLDKSNIIGRAQEAAEEYEKGKEKENKVLLDAESFLDEYMNGRTDKGDIGENDSLGESTVPEEDNSQINYLGKYVRYDVNGDGVIDVEDEHESILWKVLRNDEDKVELITADVLGTLTLTPTSFEDARLKYNSLITTVVSKCVEVTGINSVRSVGGPIQDTTTETIVFDKLTTKFEKQEGVDYSIYEGENGFKIGDDNYYKDDWNQMVKVGIAQGDNMQEYWFASRRVTENEGNITFGARYAFKDFDDYSSGGWCSVYTMGNNSFNTWPESRGVRPILTLKARALEGKSQEGTKNDPIEIYQNN